jgi:hypothetical protein
MACERRGIQAFDMGAIRGVFFYWKILHFLKYSTKRSPIYSLAKGVDYGVTLDLDLEELIIQEQYLIASRKCVWNFVEIERKPKWRKASHFY